MANFVALLRGVNVGKQNRVPMARFRDLLEKLGYTRVRTLLNSGNAVFSAPSRSADGIAKAIHGALGAKLGLDIAVVVKSAEDLAAVVKGNVLAKRGAVASRLLVVFAQDEAALRALSPLAAAARAPERVAIGKAAAYAWCPDGVSKSVVGMALLGKSGRGVTTRNWATVLKLHELLGEMEA